MYNCKICGQYTTAGVYCDRCFSLLPGQWQRGEKVVITYEGRTVDGTIVLVSTNGHSLIVEFETILGQYSGMMPVCLEEDGYHDLMFGKPLGLARASQ